MTKTQWDELYSSLYAAYVKAGLTDEFIRSSLGDLLNHMLNVSPHPHHKSFANQGLFIP